MNLLLFIWNDEADEAAIWKDVAEKAGFIDPEPVCCSLSSSTEVAKLFAEIAPDVGLLDIMAGRTKRDPVGIEIARAIRERDKLVPLIAVTKWPAEVYAQLPGMEDIPFSGIFLAKVVQADLLNHVAIRRSLNQWHASVKEYVLIREATRWLETTFEGNKALGDDVDRLSKRLQHLAFHRSIEAWHGDLFEVLAELLRERGMKELSRAFTKVGGLFLEADPIVMALRRGRRHLSHNVQVFLLGAVFLLAAPDLSKHAIRNIGDIRGDRDGQQSLFDALLVWGCVSLTHDVAYLSEYAGAVEEHLANSLSEFAGALGMAPPMLEWDWPENHHAETGAKVWRAHATHCGSADDELIDLIAKAVERHDSSRFPDDAANLTDAAWAKFLAVLCDELQDWHRERHDQLAGHCPASAPWNMFSLEVLRVHSGDRGMAIEMQFVVRDYAKFTRDRFGTAGADDVMERFQTLKEVLESNLTPERLWKIRLEAKFTSRDDLVAKKSIGLGG